MFRMIRAAGFTLIELITVIMITAIVMLGVTGFIGSGVQIYVDVTQREQILSDSRFVVERLNRELRNALPNSVRLAVDNIANPTIQCLEFVPIEWATFYTDAPVSPEPASSAIASFDLNSISDSYTLDTSDFVVIYPTLTSHVYDDIPVATTPNRRRGINSIVTSGAVATISIDDVTTFSADSPQSRIYIADNNPVSYCFDDSTDRITRYGSYGYFATQSTTPGFGAGNTLGFGSLMAENVANDLTSGTDNPFRVTEATLQRNSIVHVLLRFSRDDEIVEFNNEVHLQNTP